MSIQTMRFLLALALMMMFGCGDDASLASPDASSTLSSLSPPPARFTLEARNCAPRWSPALAELAQDQKMVVIRFRPLVVEDPPFPDCAKTIEFWLDLQDEGGLALVLVWNPDEAWFVDFYDPDRGYQHSGQTEEVTVGLLDDNGLENTFNELTVARGMSCQSSEAEVCSLWRLPSEAKLELPDSKPSRRLFAKVVGATVEFQSSGAAFSR